jgi:hypothetical protein
LSVFHGRFFLNYYPKVNWAGRKEIQQVVKQAKTIVERDARLRKAPDTYAKASASTTPKGQVFMATDALESMEQKVIFGNNYYTGSLLLHIQKSNL